MGSRIKALRERHGLSREQFCNAFEIPYRTLQSWELGTRSCPDYVVNMIDQLLQLADYMGGLDSFKRGWNREKK